MENKIIIICKSSTGFTKKYASLISRKTGARLVDFKEASPELMSGCDLVIFGDSCCLLQEPRLLPPAAP